MDDLLRLRLRLRLRLLLRLLLLLFFFFFGRVFFSSFLFVFSRFHINKEMKVFIIEQAKKKTTKEEEEDDYIIIKVGGSDDDFDERAHLLFERTRRLWTIFVFLANTKKNERRRKHTQERDAPPLARARIYTHIYTHTG